jgi:hypothetical protein
MFFQTSFDEHAYEVTDPNGSVMVSEEGVTYTSSTNVPKDIYFIAPITPGLDYTTAYGLPVTIVRLI